MRSNRQPNSLGNIHEPTDHPDEEMPRNAGQAGRFPRAHLRLVGHVDPFHSNSASRDIGAPNQPLPAYPVPRPPLVPNLPQGDAEVNQQGPNPALIQPAAPHPAPTPRNQQYLRLAPNLPHGPDGPHIHMNNLQGTNPAPIEPVPPRRHRNPRIVPHTPSDPFLPTHRQANVARFLFPPGADGDIPPIRLPTAGHPNIPPFMPPPAHRGNAPPYSEEFPHNNGGSVPPRNVPPPGLFHLEILHSGIEVYYTTYTPRIAPVYHGNTVFRYTLDYEPTHHVGFLPYLDILARFAESE